MYISDENDSKVKCNPVCGIQLGKEVLRDFFSLEFEIRVARWVAVSANSSQNEERQICYTTLIYYKYNEQLI